MCMLGGRVYVITGNCEVIEGQGALAPCGRVRGCGVTVCVDRICVMTKYDGSLLIISISLKGVL